MPMPKALKYGLYTLAGLILVLVLLVAGVVLFVDPNDYRASIEQAASENLGRQVQISGPMSLSFYPWIGLEVQDVSVANAQGFAPETMLAVQKAGFKVKLLPLLSRKVQIGTLILDQGQVHLVKDAKGRTNWQDLAKTEQKEAQDQGQADSSQGRPLGLAALTIDKIHINKTQLTWTDHSADQKVAIQDLSLSLGPVSLDSPFPFEMACRIDSTQPAVQADLTCQGEAQADLRTRTVHIRDMTLHTQAQGEAIPSGMAESTVTTTFSLNLDQGGLKVPSLVVQAYNLNLKASAQGSSLFESPSFTGRVTLESFDPKKLISALDLPEMQTADPHALTAVQASTQLQASTTSLKLSALNLGLDQTSITGQLSAELQPKIPAVAFDLSVDSIDLDRYMPPPGKEGEAPQGKETSPAETSSDQKTSPAVLPVAMLRELSVDGKMQIKDLTLQNMRMQDVTLTLQARDGQVRISPVQGSLYGGSLRSTATLDVRGQTPKVKMDTQVDTVDIQALLADLTGKKILSGLTTLKTSLSTQGLQSKDMLKNLSGTLSAGIDKGSFQGADLINQIRSTLRMIKGQAGLETQDQSTEFSSLNIDADIASGMIRKSDVRLFSPVFKLQGSGQVDLLQRSLDYLLKITFAQNMPKEYNDLSQLEGKEIPVNVAGTLQDPRFVLNKEGLISLLGQERISQELDKGIKKLQEKLGVSSSGNATQNQGEQVKDMLKGLFGGQKSN